MDAPQIADIEVGRYALRTFKVDFKRRELRALTQMRHTPSEWRGGMCEAQCRILHLARHQPPVDWCSCGIYGTNSLSALKPFGAYANQLVTVFAAEGETIVGEKGLRTAAARVVAYWSPNRGVRKICEEQCDGAKWYKNLDAMLVAYNLPRGGRTRFMGRISTTTISKFMVFLCIFMAGVDMLDAYTRIVAKHDLFVGASFAAAGLLMLFLARIHWNRWRRG